MFVSSLSECHADTLCYTYCLNLLCSFSKIYLFIWLIYLYMCAHALGGQGQLILSCPSLRRQTFSLYVSFILYSLEYLTREHLGKCPMSSSYPTMDCWHCRCIHTTDCSRGWFQAHIRRVYPLRNPTSRPPFVLQMSVKDLGLLGRKACWLERMKIQGVTGHTGLGQD